MLTFIVDILGKTNTNRTFYYLQWNIVIFSFLSEAFNFQKKTSNQFWTFFLHFFLPIFTHFAHADFDIRVYTIVSHVDDSTLPSLICTPNTHCHPCYAPPVIEAGVVFRLATSSFHLPLTRWLRTNRTLHWLKLLKGRSHVYMLQLIWKFS